jgi:hypothetical protein
LVAAACDRADFPSEVDQLLLSVAANHAATAFRTARLLDAHRRAEEALRESERQLRNARDELEMMVCGTDRRIAAQRSLFGGSAEAEPRRQFWLGRFQRETLLVRGNLSHFRVRPGLATNSRSRAPTHSSA